MNIAPITNPSVTIIPSEKFVLYLKSLNATLDFPDGIQMVVFKNAPKDVKRKPYEHKHLLTTEDVGMLKDLKHPIKENSVVFKENVKREAQNGLNLEDLYWLHEHILKENKIKEDKVYLHELLFESEVILPKNVEIPRNKELEKRCVKLRLQQQNREYNRITRNVDNVRKKLPEDTIAYQMKQINRHLIAVFQFIMSVLAGFAFGFLGVEWLLGNLDFGFRLLLGIMCALVIALAELYFLAKKLNEDLQFEMNPNPKKTKVD